MHVCVFYFIRSPHGSSLIGYSLSVKGQFTRLLSSVSLIPSDFKILSSVKRLEFNFLTLNEVKKF